MTNPCCKDCPDRHTACHDSCPKFAEWRREHAAEADYTRRMTAIGKVYRRNWEDKHREKGKKRFLGHNGGDW